MSSQRHAGANLPLLFDHLVAGVVVHAPNGEVVHANQRACELLGQSRKQIVGKGLQDATWQLVHEDGAPMSVEDYPVSRVLRFGPPLVNLTVGIVRGPDSGDIVWVLCNAYTEPSPENPRRRRVVMMLVDVTDRVGSERALAESAKRYRQLYEAHVDGVLLTGSGGKIVGANLAACQMLTRTEAEITACGLDGLFDPGDVRAWELLAKLEDKQRAIGRLRMLRGDGQPLEVEVSAVSFDNEDGTWNASFVLCDCTLQRDRDDAVAALSLAEAANHQKSAFVAKVNHELRTPLNAVLGLATVLQHEAAAGTSMLDRARLDLIVEAGGHLLRLVDDLLDFSAVESGALSLQLETIEPAAITREVVGQIAGLAAGRRVSIDLQEPAPDLRVRADSGRLRQVLWNLLSNAVKYNRECGRVTISFDGSLSEVCIAVNDTGIGMTPVQVAGLFKPFDRLGREASGVHGAGIGLALSRHLAGLMGGRIEVDSHEDHGSTFTVRLPRADATHAEAPMAARNDAVALLADRPVCVLCIDDEAVNRLVMRGMVELQRRWRFLEADSGDAGLALARRERPDVLMIDLVMPGLDGYAVLRAVRSDPTLHRLPCIAVSALAMPDAIREALAQGFDGYIAKPVMLQAWLNEIARVMPADHLAR